jgi:hypothetical protein
MRSLLVVLALAATLGAVAQVGARPEDRAKAAVIGMVADEEGEGSLLAGRPVAFRSAGGVSKGRWRNSPDTRGLLPKGARLSRYELTRGRVGEIEITGAGKLGGPAPEGYETYGAEFPARVILGKHEAAQPGLAGLAVWHSPGSPAPRWIAGKVQNPKLPAYRKTINDWLTARGVSAKLLKAVKVNQVVKADINRDGRDELFLAFRTPNEMDGAPRGQLPKKPFSYLVMQYRPSRTGAAKIAVLSDWVYLEHEVLGFCDLDGDGWAEVVAGTAGIDHYGCNLNHWEGKRFQQIKGWGFGA